MINIKNLKTYLPFAILCGLLLITIIASIIIYLEYTEKLGSAKTPDEALSLDINLPVIQWAKYESLSKKYTNDKLEK